MKFQSFILALALLVPSWGFGQDVSEKPMLLFTASPAGTYYRFAEDLKKACPHLNIEVLPSAGSLENLNTLVQIPKTDRGRRVAFAQQDVVSTVLGTDSKAATAVRVVQTMYGEDINVLVSRTSNISRLKDLEGKKVSIGTVGSGNWFTSNALRQNMGAKWIAIERSPEESILAVITGEIDAMIYVAGQPVKMFTDLGAKMKGYIKLVSLQDTELNKLYAVSTLPANTYPWQDSQIELRSTKSVLLAANDVPLSSVRDLQACMFDKQSELRKWGHPRWKDVQFDQARIVK